MTTTAAKKIVPPPAPAVSRLATYLSKQIDALQGIKTQGDIAREAGFEKPNIISMFKLGKVKVPLDRIPALATAMNVDPAFMFRLALEEYWPDRLDAINTVMGTVASKNEAEILFRIRELTNNGDPALTEALDDQLTKVFAP